MRRDRQLATATDRRLNPRVDFAGNPAKMFGMNLKNSSGNERAGLGRFLLEAIRFYTYNTPIKRGRHRAYLLGMKLCRDLPEVLPAETKDGRKFDVHLATGMQTTVYFLGEYETALTKIVTELLRPEDVCLDVGANFGWYTTLFHKYAAEVHAFEPTPPIFEELARNRSLMANSDRVFINNLALGDRPDELTVNLFEGLSTGHASLSTQGRSDAVSFKCKVITLDSYLSDHSVADVNFVKVDIEGAEMMFLKGAERIFSQEVPPIWLMEMAVQQTRNFGYEPNDLLHFFRERADYDFYMVDEPTTRLVKFGEFPAGHIGANVICFPRGHYRDRLAALNQFIGR